MDVSGTVNSGQVFLWERTGGAWLGVNGGDVIRIRDGGPGPEHDGFFRMDDDYDGIMREISGDALVRRCVKRYRGLRLLRQDPFQCCVSFIASSNSSIPNIRTRLQRLCRAFGARRKTGDGEIAVFPSPKRLAAASQAELLACGLGYRARFVGSAARMVRDGLDLESLKSASYTDAKERLTGIPGVGDKVADCIMLFSLDKLDAFPLDTWTLRVISGPYSGRFFMPGKSLTPGRYAILHDMITDYFGKYCGYSQQFLFKWIRDQSGRRWLG